MFVATPVFHLNGTIFVSNTTLNITTTTTDASIYYTIDGGSAIQYPGAPVFLTCTSATSICNLTIVTWVCDAFMT